MLNAKNTIILMATVALTVAFDVGIASAKKMPLGDKKKHFRSFLGQPRTLFKWRHLKGTKGSQHVRMAAKVSLGRIDVKAVPENDSLFRYRYKFTVILKDVKGNILFRKTTRELFMRGKPPGKAIKGGDVWRTWPLTDRQYRYGTKIELEATRTGGESLWSWLKRIVK